MGIPKFFRWLSERYPLINIRISDTLIPQFDNLYLDMNGILHTCSHPNDSSVHEAMSEQEIISRTFQYLDKIVQIVQPKKVLYLAVDGCAPRAKINQQRQRRFRHAKELEETIESLKSKGKKPPDSVFDSNCITPGTDFMRMLSECLKYFIRKKIDEDNVWKNLQIVYSGHEVPGEGEHKIIEWIRHQKALPGWGDNVTHCLYGLDADLIMLALTTHEHHFALLREDVLSNVGRYNKDDKKGSIEAQEFQLLHVGLLREYLDLDFRTDKLPFPYDLERIVDDFILMCFFIGNDFLPQLPWLEINEGALNRILEIYKEVLPTLNDYLTRNGEMNMENCEVFVRRLSSIEQEAFKMVNLGYKDTIDSDGFSHKKNNSNHSRNFTGHPHSSSLSGGNNNNVPENYNNSSTEDNEDRHLSALTSQFPNGNTSNIGAHGQGQSQGQSQGPSRIAAKFKQKFMAPSDDEDDAEESWRSTYYHDRFKIDDLSRFIPDICSAYIDGLRWVLYYYYYGCVSWNWFYPYHYAPLATDLSKVAQYNRAKVFEMSRPFLPFQQLLGVLPPSNANLLPKAYRFLMTEKSSPIADFYPPSFTVDLNGKKNAWEAVALIPFINEERLLKAIESIDSSQLTEEEANTNKFGPVLVFDHKSEATDSPVEDSSDLGEVLICGIKFPKLKRNLHVEREYPLPALAPETVHSAFRKGPTPPTPALPGFPTLKTLPFTKKISYAGVNIFGNAGTRRESVVIEVEPEKPEDLSRYAERLVGKTVFVEWPYHREALVVGVSDKETKFTEQGPAPVDDLAWIKELKLQRTNSLTKRGVNLGDIRVLVHVQLLKGVIVRRNGAKIKWWSDDEKVLPLQLVLEKLPARLTEPRYESCGPLSVDKQFPVGTRIICLAEGPHFSQRGRVFGHNSSGGLHAYIDHLAGSNSDQSFQQRLGIPLQDKYFPLRHVSRKLNISPRVLSKVTGSIYVEPGRKNLGLNIKFTGKNQQVIGYTRKEDSSKANDHFPQQAGFQRQQDPWEFSSKAVELISDYKSKFPEVFEALELGANDEALAPNELFPNAPDVIAKIRELEGWLKSLPSFKLSRVACGESSIMTDEAISVVEEETWKLHEFVHSAKSRAVSVSLMPWEAIAPMPSDNNRGIIFEALATEKLRLGDRVIYIHDGGFVPFGLKGTVVEVFSSSVSVVFDTEFVSGSTLNNRCKAYRGMSDLPIVDLLNLTNPPCLTPSNSSFVGFGSNHKPSGFLTRNHSNNNRTGPGSVQSSPSKKSFNPNENIDHRYESPTPSSPIRRHDSEGTGQDQQHVVNVHYNNNNHNSQNQTVHSPTQTHVQSPSLTPPSFLPKNAGLTNESSVSPISTPQKSPSSEEKVNQPHVHPSVQEVPQSPTKVQESRPAAPKSKNNKANKKYQNNTNGNSNNQQVPTAQPKNDDRQLQGPGGRNKSFNSGTKEWRPVSFSFVASSSNPTASASSFSDSASAPSTSPSVPRPSQVQVQEPSTTSRKTETNRESLTKPAVPQPSPLPSSPSLTSAGGAQPIALQSAPVPAPLPQAQTPTQPTNSPGSHSNPAKKNQKSQHHPNVQGQGQGQVPRKHLKHPHHLQKKSTLPTRPTPRAGTGLSTRPRTRYPISTSTTGVGACNCVTTTSSASTSSGPSTTTADSTSATRSRSEPKAASTTCARPSKTSQETTKD
eukprot:TRINITY_DN5010_c0_g5_i2.p1 TRINITY_DN5010_c0_g5~~TRINITY_DN5010_c0_g5_i2.p1  ORF type:complete len:1677 (+),score=317.46 TRINITY_DN5010_c0_g5_i2:59-5089(+)